MTRILASTIRSQPASLLATGLVLTLASCAGTSGTKGKTASSNKRMTPPEQPPIYSWDEELVKSTSGPVKIKIGIEQQRARFFKGGKEIGWTTVASGVPSHPTPTGSFSILEKTRDKKSNLYGRIYNSSGDCIESDAKMGRDPIPAGGRFEGSRMEYWMRLTSDGVGMHIGPQPRPGYRASHGCIRLPAYMAQQFFEHAPVGTPVTIVSDDGTEPLSKARDAYEAQLAEYTTWVNGEWDKHNARMAKSPEVRKAAREKLKAEKEAKEMAERAAKKAAREASNQPAQEIRAAEPVGGQSAPAGPGQTVYLDPNAA